MKKKTNRRPGAAKTAPAAQSPTVVPVPRIYTQAEVDQMIPTAVAASRFRPTKKICILGTTPSRTMAPFDDMSWEMWSIGPGGKDSNRWDILFELHGADTWPTGFKRRIGELDQLLKQAGAGAFPAGVSEHIEALQRIATAPDAKTSGAAEAFDTYIQALSAVQPEERECAPGHKVTRAVCTMEAMRGWASNEVFPKDHIVQKYGRMWMSSSISWCIALAIELQATDIGIYGVDLESGEEYESQFEGSRALIDIARIGMGIRIHLPRHCGLLRDPNPYPDRWETAEALYVQEKIRYLEPILGERRATLAREAAEINCGEGRLAELRGLLPQEPDNEALKKQIATYEQAITDHRHLYDKTTAEINRIEGEIDFAQHFMRMFVHKSMSRPHQIE